MRRNPSRGLSLSSIMLLALAAVGVVAICAVIGGVGYLILTTPVVRDVVGIPSEPTPTPVPFPTPTPNPDAVRIEPPGRIVYTCYDGEYDQVCIMNADGTNKQQITDLPSTDWYASLAPDSSLVSFSTRRDNNFEIYIMDIDGSSPARLTRNLGGNYAPEINSNGTQIVFVSTINGKQDIYTMGIDGTNPTRITIDESDDFDPTWSPDGSQIAFTSNRTGTNEIYIINADGSDEHQITSGSGQLEGGRVDWSPDGLTLAFYAGPRTDKDIFTVPVSCADEPAPCGPDHIVRLTDGGNNKAPTYSPDGLWIAFASNFEGDNEIFIMRADGSDWRQLTFNDLADWQPRWGP